ncbi:unnamed protein product [Leptidea sinapis]|uniref:Calponin-homology (CH) domain-containing protein n=1 Tax=Leptidea sinapis TaxID=189913 RepID=A0A5E4QZE7_9NEOP|nr:unnamed protein product [Leptidea sinapis]
MAAGGEDLWRECANWLTRCGLLRPDHKANWETSTIHDLAYTLRDGVLLCNLLNVLHPGCVDMKDVNQRPQMAQLRETDLFDPSMLFDLSNFHRVLCTLAKISQSPKALAKNVKPFSASRTQSEEDIYKELQSLASSSHSLEKRDYVIRELVDTECNYVDNLHEIHTGLLRQLRLATETCVPGSGAPRLADESIIDWDGGELGAGGAVLAAYGRLLLDGELKVKAHEDQKLRSRTTSTRTAWAFGWRSTAWRREAAGEHSARTRGGRHSSTSCVEPRTPRTRCTRAPRSVAANECSLFGRQGYLCSVCSASVHKDCIALSGRCGGGSSLAPALPPHAHQPDHALHYYILNSTLKWPFRRVVATVIHDFRPLEATQLALRPGSKVLVLSKEGDSRGWWKGRILDKVVKTIFKYGLSATNL